MRFPERAAQATPERLAHTLERGSKALGIMNTRLKENPFLAGQTYSVADISLCAYTHLARDGGFELEEYPAMLAWLERVQNDPGHVGLDWKP